MARITPNPIPADLAKGDRVRVELTNGDEATFTVHGVDRNSFRDYLISKNNVYSARRIARVTVLQKAKPPLPTEPGFYRGSAWSDANPSLGYHLSSKGVWRIIWSDGEVTDTEAIDTAANGPLIRLVKEVTR